MPSAVCEIADASEWAFGSHLDRLGNCFFVSLRASLLLSRQGLNSLFESCAFLLVRVYLEHVSQTCSNQ